MPPPAPPVAIRVTDRFPEPGFATLQRRVFADLEQYSEVLEALARAEAGAAGAGRTHPPPLRIGAYEGDELVGWSVGWMERHNTFYMANSGVIETHRRRGIYTALLDAVRAHALAAGAWAIRSQHSVVNNPIIIAKLRAGFAISGLSQSARMGALVELTLHLSGPHDALYRQRVVPYRAQRTD